jgi:hypothetical protein
MNNVWDIMRAFCRLIFGMTIFFFCLLYYLIKEQNLSILRFYVLLLLLLLLFIYKNTFYCTGVQHKLKLVILHAYMWK